MSSSASHQSPTTHADGEGDTMMSSNTQHDHKTLTLFYNCTSKCLLKEMPGCDLTTIYSYSDQERQEILNWAECFDIKIPLISTHPAFCIASAITPVDSWADEPVRPEVTAYRVRLERALEETLLPQQDKFSRLSVKKIWWALCEIRGTKAQKLERELREKEMLGGEDQEEQTCDQVKDVIQEMMEQMGSLNI